MFAGRFQDAVRELETYATLAPREPNPYDSLGDAYLLMGSPDQAVAAFSRALSIDPRFTHGGRAWALGMLGRHDEALREAGTQPYLKAVLLARVGRYAEAQKTLQQAVRDADADGDFWRASGVNLLRAMLSLEQGDAAGALEACRAAEDYVARLPAERRRVDRVVLDLIAGVAELRRGNRAAAESHLASSTSIYRVSIDAERWWHDTLAAEIALAARDLDRAQALFTSGVPASKTFVTSLPQGSVLANDPMLRDGLARVAGMRGDRRTAIDRYRRLLASGPDQKFVAVFEPRYVLAIARLLDESGDHSGARAEYQRFLQFWSHADADLPELAEARRALARLVA